MRGEGRRGTWSLFSILVVRFGSGEGHEGTMEITTFTGMT